MYAPCHCFSALTLKFSTRNFLRWLNLDPVLVCYIKLTLQKVCDWIIIRCTQSWIFYPHISCRKTMFQWYKLIYFSRVYSFKQWFRKSKQNCTLRLLSSNYFRPEIGDKFILKIFWFLVFVNSSLNIFVNTLNWCLWSIVEILKFKIVYWDWAFYDFYIRFK